MVADAPVREAFGQLEKRENWLVIGRWLAEHRITALGFSYRLDLDEGQVRFSRVIKALQEHHLTGPEKGKIGAVYFAGLPRTYELIRSRHPYVTGTFCGDETPAETLRILGISLTHLPPISCQRHHLRRGPAVFRT